MVEWPLEQDLGLLLKVGMMLSMESLVRLQSEDLKKDAEGKSPVPLFSDVTCSNPSIPWHLILNVQLYKFLYWQSWHFWGKIFCSCWRLSMKCGLQVGSRGPVGKFQIIKSPCMGVEYLNSKSKTDFFGTGTFDTFWFWFSGIKKVGSCSILSCMTKAK